MSRSAEECISDSRDEYGYIWSYTHTPDAPTDTLLGARVMAANVAADLAVKKEKPRLSPRLRPSDDRAACAECHKVIPARWRLQHWRDAAAAFKKHLYSLPKLEHNPDYAVSPLS